MIKTGVVSVTFRKKNPRELIDITRQAGLDCIEWGSDVHVPQGDVKTAHEVRNMTIDAGLEIASYGSYYYLGSDIEFEPFLESALALGASNIRVWAGKIASNEISDTDRAKIIEDAFNISSLAEKENVKISTEYHNDSLTDSCEATLSFLNSVGHKNFYTYWQQPLDVAPVDQLPALERIILSGKLTNVHVYQYENRVQMPLASGKSLWEGYFTALKETGVPRYALMEFVRGGTDEAFLEDAAFLRSLK